MPMLQLLLPPPQLLMSLMLLPLLLLPLPQLLMLDMPEPSLPQPTLDTTSDMPQLLTQLLLPPLLLPLLNSKELKVDKVDMLQDYIQRRYRDHLQQSDQQGCHRH